MTDLARFRVAILIVGYRNPTDIRDCVTALSHATTEPTFDIFICENGGPNSYHRLKEALIAPNGPCANTSTLDGLSFARPSRLARLECLSLMGRNSRVWIGVADRNLGYAGAVNLWAEALLEIPGWKGVWILNPDTEPEPGALEALVHHSLAANKGMVGSTIVSVSDRSRIHCRAGHRWRKFMGRSKTLGFHQPLDAPVDIGDIERDLDSISGASIYVTRMCLEQIGPMDERYFLYYEDVDWAKRAKRHGLGYAKASIVPHKGGSTIGSSSNRANRSPLSVYLESRNRIHFIRKNFPLYFPLAVILSFVYAAEFLFVRSPQNFKFYLLGLMAALKGEIGAPYKLLPDAEWTNRFKKVLVISTQWWPPAARVAGALAKLGFDVASLSPPGAAIRKLSDLRRHFHYRKWASLRSISHAIAGWNPHFLICADDEAVRHLHRLYKLVSDERNGEAHIGELIRRSLGDPLSFDMARARSQLIPYATSIGIRCPETTLLNIEGSLDSSQNYPLVVKTDDSFGGTGVRYAKDAADTHTAIQALQFRTRHPRLAGTFRLIARAIGLRNRVQEKGGVISLQAHVAGRPANSAVVCFKGRILGIMSVEVVRTLSRFGPATVVRIIDNHEMTEAAARLVDHLGLTGFIGLDFVLDDHQRAWLVEMNPRLTPTSHFLLRNGTALALPELPTPYAGATRDGISAILAHPRCPGSTIVLFPQELLRTPRSKYIGRFPHDVPWKDVKLVQSCLDSVAGQNLLQRLRRKLGI